MDTSEKILIGLVLTVIICGIIVSGIGIRSNHYRIIHLINNGYEQRMVVGYSEPIWVKY